MQLNEAILTIQYDSDWAIWADLIDGKLKRKSEARFGQKVLENGGILDGKVFVCNGETAGDHISDWRCDWGFVDGWFEALIDPINEEQPWNEED